MKQRIEKMNLYGKKVIVRFDYNVPVQNGRIMDDTKIRESLETLEYLLKNNCKIIILSHMGKIKTEEDKLKNTLEPVAKRLKELLFKEVYFSKKIVDPELEARISSMQAQDIILLENTRFLDIPNKLESNCDTQTSAYLASLGEVFVMDAFASAHRNHASTVGITKYLPSCMGFLIEKELLALDKYLKTPEHPFTVIMGGAKVEDKLELIEALIPKCDHLLLAGGLANSFLKALNFNIGSSLATTKTETIEKLKQILINNRNKIQLPLDAIVRITYDENETHYRKINEVEDNDIILDIGYRTTEKYKTTILNSKTIFLNGTMGQYEDIRFSNGTKEIFSILKTHKGVKIVGGGDSVSAVNYLGYKDDFTYLSCGGGATLEYISKGHLIGIDSIMEEKAIEVLDV